MRGGLAFLLLWASVAWGSVTAVTSRGIGCVVGVTDAATCARPVAAAPVGAEGATPVDWSGSFDALWRLERDGTNDGTCGSGCAVSASSGSASFGAATAREGYSGLGFPVAGDRFCTDASCGATTDGDGSTAIAVGCMARLANASAARTMVFNFTTGASGYRAQVNTSRQLVCTVGASPDVALTSTTAVTLDRWTALACAYSAIGAVFVDGTAEGAGAQGNPTNDAQTFNLSLNGATSWLGALDLCWLRRGSTTTAQLCRIAMCGITGTEFGCTCASAGTGLASYAQRGRYDSAGMTCTPSDCTAAAP